MNLENLQIFSYVKPIQYHLLNHFEMGISPLGEIGGVCCCLWQQFKGIV